MKILIEELENPYANKGGLVALRKRNAFQEAIDQMVAVDLSEMAVNWLLDEVQEIGEVASGKIIVKGKPFEQYLKEQMERK